MRVTKSGVILLVGILLTGCAGNQNKSIQGKENSLDTVKEVNETPAEKTFVDKKMDFWEGNFAYQIISDNEVWVTNVESEDNKNGTSKSIKIAEIPEYVKNKEKEYHVTGIGEGAFDLCTNLEEVNMPNSIREIDRNAFAECLKLSKIQFSKNLEEIKYGAFSGADVSAITLDNIILIDENGFACCTKLKSLDLSKSIKKVTPYAFGECKNLETVTIRAIKLNIEENVFYGCKKLKVFYVPKESVEYYKKALSEYKAEVKAIEE
ncbi:leucine-rich repeat domain-containing protein [Anaerosacchariphilus polymeriproducens]|uniref:Leucine-rich repeat domain-containing protein n=1 Tax=Anaerosacchariphilus polymeriproducens TaxID=1812858 RepID=A0A371AXE7_9FIRM|nr:leucine-rich repeat domain-containing protein [Anaerosacchariphilus polymeriproducens]RDU24237.1 leucine-rich repeat domain-containing protein [Anaerosacchariphilus polymeriproducens]